MSTNYKYQEEFADDMAAAWRKGDHSLVRTTIRNLKNKAQAAYIAAMVAIDLEQGRETMDGSEDFLAFMHPNEK